MEQFAPAEHLSLNHRLVERLPLHADRSCFRFVGDDGEIVAERTLGEVVRRARRIAAALERKHGLTRGDRAVLVYLPSLDFVEAFLACLLSGVVPAALMPPDPFGSDVAHLYHVVQNAQAKAILSHRAYHRARMFGRLGRAARLRKRVEWPALPWVITDAVRGRAEAEIYLPEPETLAFLQYTSGSTGEPRGVRVTHGNLAHNQTYNCEYAGLDERGSLVIWVPHYHDFGLNCGILGTLWTHAELTLLSPLSFLRRPALWPELMHRFRATATAAPNFALELTRRKTSPEQRARWDLSRLHLVALGGEAVQAVHVDRFAAAFAPAKLDPKALGNCYGLAEHVVDVMGPGYDRIRVDPQALLDGELRQTRADAGRELFDCGPPNEYVRVRIVDPDTRARLPDAQIGEIWVCSPAKADGYEGLECSETFAARTEPDDGFRYLRTGDLGGMIDGRLYVTGRIKELIIVRGHNLIPTDIEAALLDVDPAVRPGRVAAFGAEDESGTEQVVIFAELRDDVDEARYPQICAAIRSTVTSRVPGGTVGTVVLGRRGLIHKTSSGKIQRGLARRDFLSPAFASRPAVVHVDARARELELELEALAPMDVEARADQSLRALVVDALDGVLGVPVDAELLARSPRELGLDSTQVVELQVELEDHLDIELDPKLVLAAGSFEEVLVQLGARDASASMTQGRRPLIHVERWREHALAELELDERGPWLVLGPDAERLVASLRASGLEVEAGQLGALATDDPELRLVLDCTDASREPEAAIERCRGLAQALERGRSRLEVQVLTRAAVACDASERAEPGAAAVRGFCRSLRAASPRQRWSLRDLASERERLDSAAAWLDDGAAELALRGDRVLAPSVERVASTLPAAEDALPFGGAALIVGPAGPASTRAAKWLAQTRGVERLVTLLRGASEPPAFVAELRDAELEVTHVPGALADEPARAEALAALGGAPSWIVFVAAHDQSAAPIRHTRGRVDAAFEHGWRGLEALAEASASLRGVDTHLLVLSDLSPWFGPPTRASWAASATALRACVESLARDGHGLTHVAAGPLEGELPPRELAKYWRPAGIVALRGADDLPFLDDVLSAGLTSAGVWAALSRPSPHEPPP